MSYNTTNKVYGSHYSRSNPATNSTHSSFSRFHDPYLPSTHKSSSSVIGEPLLRSNRSTAAQSLITPQPKYPIKHESTLTRNTGDLKPAAVYSTNNEYKYNSGSSLSTSVPSSHADYSNRYDSTYQRSWEPDVQKSFFDQERDRYFSNTDIPEYNRLRKNKEAYMDSGSRISSNGRDGTSNYKYDQASINAVDDVDSWKRREQSPSRSRSRNRDVKSHLEPPPPYEQSLTRGTVGLENMGNTCYFSCAVQCISNTPQLRDVILGQQYRIQENSDSKGAVITAFRLLLQELWCTQTPRSSTRPKDMLKSVANANSQFEGYRQQDAQEMLLFLLNALSEETNRVNGFKNSGRKDSQALLRPKSVASLNHVSAEESWQRFLSNESSFVTDVVAGQLESILKCKVCNHQSVTYESFFQLSLPLNSGEESNSKSDWMVVTLDDCFKLFCADEVLDGDNSVLCEKCRRPQPCGKSLRIERLPDVLIIQLKRFSLDFRNKINIPVDAPLRKVCLLEYMTAYQAKRCKNPPLYRLYAVIDHIGSPRSGHYIAKCRVPSPPSESICSAAAYRTRNSVNHNKDALSNQSPRSSLKAAIVPASSSTVSRSKAWWKFDDSEVLTINENDVICCDNYILFYEKVS